MANLSNLNKHLLRTLLLEGENGEKILKAVKVFNLSKQTDEDLANLADVIRKDISRTAKELLSEESVNSFISETTTQLQM